MIFPHLSAKDELIAPFFKRRWLKNFNVGREYWRFIVQQEISVEVVSKFRRRISENGTDCGRICGERNSSKIFKPLDLTISYDGIDGSSIRIATRIL